MHDTLHHECAQTWKMVPSRSVYAVTACCGIRNVTNAMAFDFFVFGSMGMLISDTGPAVHQMW